MLDANGNPVDGATVTFTLGSGSGGTAARGRLGATGAVRASTAAPTQATELTDRSGIATSPLVHRQQRRRHVHRHRRHRRVSSSRRAYSLDNLAGKPPRSRCSSRRKPDWRRSGARYGKPLQVKLTRRRAVQPSQGSDRDVHASAREAEPAASAAGAASAGRELRRRLEHANDRDNRRLRGRDLAAASSANTTAGTLHSDRNGRRRRPTAAAFTLDNLAGKPPTIKPLGPAKQLGDDRGQPLRKPAAR